MYQGTGKGAENVFMSTPLLNPGGIVSCDFWEFLITHFNFTSQINFKGVLIPLAGWPKSVVFHLITHRAMANCC